MTDDLLPCLGWIPSPDDERDWGVDALYAATGTEPPAALPASYHVPPPLYPVVDQGSSPMCVAYSAAGEQGWYDLRDTGLALFDEALFFRQIGGTASGAVIRDALSARLSAGYPPQGHPELAGQHRIAAYYAVPVARPVRRDPRVRPGAGRRDGRPTRRAGTGASTPRRRFMLSIPPTTTRSASPARICEAASMIALSPDPQTRLMAVAGTDAARPDPRAA